MPCGPRVYTFFLYLSDGVDGGNTSFPLLRYRPDVHGTDVASLYSKEHGLEVKPKLGAAVLWGQSRKTVNIDA